VRVCDKRTTQQAAGTTTGAVCRGWCVCLHRSLPSVHLYNHFGKQACSCRTCAAPALLTSLWGKKCVRRPFAPVVQCMLYSDAHPKQCRYVPTRALVRHRLFATCRSPPGPASSAQGIGMICLRANTKLGLQARHRARLVVSGVPPAGRHSRRWQSTDSPDSTTSNSVTRRDNSGENITQVVSEASTSRSRRLDIFYCTEASRRRRCTCWVCSSRTRRSATVAGNSARQWSLKLGQHRAQCG
jgi:hypothetical protein